MVARKTKKKSKTAKKTVAKKVTRKPAKKAAKKKSIKAATKKKSKKTSLTLRGKKVQGIKAILLSQKDNLLREAEEALNLLPGEINFPDMGDQATAEADRDFMLRLRDRERMLLKKIDEAVERIDTNTYGICENCSNQIGIKRLEARPVTSLCIDCKTQQEEEERIAEGG
ncbi:MAG TPA: RNA polymerase-binding protein DksA [Nitrospirae bacterium]|nr:RNA polymerase-binding transcription factor DksA [bacterium BMS3Abin10]GBE39387.1 RNA polymerase-binding transcription factor DksA [bacterium BMS3Bbin08]HDK81173.1 RNA polymerase-binding protein DksA [Nitrospirota bacterium]